MANENRQYFKSADIRVFPCSFRGNYTIEYGENQGQTYTFDPESRLTTEYNFTHLHSVGDPNSSYVIAFDEEDESNKILYCVIGGYYFEISHIDPEQLKNKVLAIKFKEIELKPDTVDSATGATSIDSSRNTKVLKSWEGTAQDLDAKLSGETDYKFYGLAITNDSDPSDAKLSGLFDDSGKFNKEVLKPIFSHGKGENSLRFGENNDASGKYSITQGYYTKASGDYSHAEGIGEIIGEDNVTINYTTADGDGAHAEGYVTKANGDHSHSEGLYTKANGNGAHAEGKGADSFKNSNPVNAKGDYSHSEGYKTQAKKAYAHAEGKETIADGEAAHTSGLGTKTTKDYATIVGKYNKDVDGEFIVGIGTGSEDANRNNALVVNGKTTTIKNTINVVNDSDATTFKTTPTTTDILTATNTIKGTTNEIKVDDSHGLKIAVDSNGNSTTLADDKITIHSGAATNGAYIMLEKDKGILISQSNTNYDPAEVIEEKTIKIASEKIKINGENTTLTATTTITNNIGKDEKLKINKDATTLTNSTLTLNGTSITKIQKNGADKITVDSNGTTIADNSITIKVDDNHKVVINSSNTTITGNTDITSNLTIGGNAMINSGALYLGNNNDTEGTIYYKNIPILVTKKGDAAHPEYGCGVILGGNGLTAIMAGEGDEFEDKISSWNSESLYLTADSNAYIYTNTTNTSAGGWANSKQWTFDKNGNTNCPGTVTTAGNLTITTGGAKITGNTAITGNTTITGDLKAAKTFSIGNGTKDATIKDGVGSGIIDIYGSEGHLYLDANEILTSNAGGLYLGAYDDSNSIQITKEGQVIANSYKAKSDARLKENIVEYKSEKSILDLPIYKYDFINGAKNQIGCLAQDLQKICPEIVSENANGYLSIEESKIIYLLLDEVKKLKKEINELKKE